MIEFPNYHKMLLSFVKKSVFNICTSTPYNGVIIDLCEERWAEVEKYWRECRPDSPIFNTDKFIKKLNDPVKMLNYVNWNDNCSLKMFRQYLENKHGHGHGHGHIYFRYGFLYYIDEKLGVPFKQLYDLVQFIRTIDNDGYGGRIYINEIRRTPKSSEDAEFRDKIVQLGIKCKNITYSDIGFKSEIKKYYEDIWKFSRLLKN